MLKMAVAIVPAFLNLNKKTVSSAILQLELETKNDKEGPGKDSLKEKKFFDEYLTCLHEHKLPVAEFNRLHHLENVPYKQAYHPTILTPPPNV